MLEIDSLAKTYGSGEKATEAIRSISFTVAEKEFVCVVGPSGCGKTTLLKCVAGLLAPTSGAAFLNGKAVTSPPDEMALVFQEYSRSLMPWSSVRNNVLLPLRHKPLSRAERSALVEESLEAVGLTRFIDHYPWQLSGGMQQRVAIARALSFEPAILLMDEPFGALDEMTRERMNQEVQRIWHQTGITVVFVTHSIPEAVFLSSRVVVMSARPGRITDVIGVDLPRPRTEETRETERYFELVTAVREALRGRGATEEALSGEGVASPRRTMAEGAVG